jgi:hypothetical protein
MLALIFEPVLANEDGVGVSAPLAHQCRACPQHDTGIGGPAALLELSGQRLVRPKNRGPDQCAPVIRSAITVSERVIAGFIRLPSR